MLANSESVCATVPLFVLTQLIGLAIYNGVLLDLSFPMVVYRKLVGIKPTLRDLTAWKPDVGKSLATLLEYDKEDLESVFCLNFTYTVEVGMGPACLVFFHQDVIPMVWIATDVWCDGNARAEAGRRSDHRHARQQARRVSAPVYSMGKPAS